MSDDCTCPPCLVARAEAECECARCVNSRASMASMIVELRAQREVLEKMSARIGEAAASAMFRDRRSQ